jgi:aminoglycoside phosphotransferase family enzyme/predicted kinase
MEKSGPSAADGEFPRLVHEMLERRLGEPVRRVETHISWVFVSRRLAFKLKKPVRLPFADFSTPALRRQACEEELRLNRRLAPSLYRGLVSLRGSRARPRLGGHGRRIDTLVVMRRFPDDALLGRRLAAGRLRPEDVERLALRIAAFHERADVVGAEEGDAAARAVAPVEAVLAQLGEHVEAPALAAVTAWLRERMRSLAPVWRARQAAGAVRDGHGDLHLDNAVVLGDDVTAFDCLEFDPALRRIDVMSDIAFMTMDLKAHGRADLAARFLDAYLERRGDYHGLRILRFHEVYRALVRALVARLRPGAPAEAPSGPDYLALAGRLVDEEGAQPRLAIVCGLSGAGKSTLAGALLAATGAVRVRSDVERKRLFGLGSHERSDTVPGGIYGPEAGARTYQRLAACAGAALAGGYPVIVDATFLARAQRQAFRALAAALGVPFAIFACDAAESVLRSRVSARRAAGGDPSEADVLVLEQQMREREAWSPDELAFVMPVDTTKPPPVAELAARWTGIAGR